MIDLRDYINKTEDNTISKGAFKAPSANYESYINERYNNIAQKSIELNTDLTDKYTEENREFGVPLNHVDDEQTLEKIRAENQSNFAKFGDFLMQAAVGEVVLGTLEGFGNIWDGAKYLITGEYEENAWSKSFRELKEGLKDEFKIHQGDHSAFAMGDFGWWMNNGVNVASTLSLLLPAAGWARGIGLLGKATRLSKLGNWTSKTISKGLAKAITKQSGNLDTFGALRTVSGTAGKINRSIKDFGNAAGFAAISRTGENMLEAKEVFNTVYPDSYENLKNMQQNNPEEFEMFLNNNPEFKGKDIDEIAKAIANKSAYKTFINDYWMLVSDVLQFKALGSLFKGGKRSVSAAERIAAKNARKTLAGDDKLIKNTFWNRRKENIGYALKHPFSSTFTTLQIGEGFEEVFQGIQNEKGFEVAAQYFDPTLTPKSISSYLKDGHIWEQGFWGMIGGITFGLGYKGVRALDNKYEHYKNKKHMSAEEYERWKKSEEDIALEQINGVKNRIDLFNSRISEINDGKNPYNFKIDPTTGKRIINDKGIVREEIDETQQQLLRQEALRELVDDTTLDAVDRGTFDLMKSILGSKEFDKYIENSGYKIDNSERLLSKEILDRMDTVAGIYDIELENTAGLVNEVNPFVTTAAARYVTRQRLLSENIDLRINNLNERINNNTHEGNDYTNYSEIRLYKSIQDELLRLNNILQRINKEYSEGKLSKEAYDRQTNELRTYVNGLKTLARDNTIKGAIEEFTNPEFSQAFDEFYKAHSEVNNPVETLADYINEKNNYLITKAFVSAQIPNNSKEYKDLYDSFAASMDKVYQNRADEYIKRVDKYFENADNLEEARTNLLNGNIKDKKLKEAMRFLKYGYIKNIYDENSRKSLDQIMIDTLFDSIYEDAVKKRQQQEAQNAEEESLGMTPRTNENTAVVINNNETRVEENEENAEKNKENIKEEKINNEEKQIANENPSMGEETKATIPVEPEDTINDKSHEIPPVEDYTANNSDIPQPSNEDIKIATIRAAISSYIARLAYNNEKLVNDIVTALENNNEKPLEDFVESIKNKLIQEKQDINLIDEYLIKFIKDAIFVQGLDPKNPFAGLVKLLSINYADNDRNSNTILLDDKQKDEAVEYFLEEYAKINNLPTENGIIINITELFKQILNDKEISANRAKLIYDKIGEYISRNNNEKYIFTGFEGIYSRMSAEEFFNNIKINKTEIIDETEGMHLFMLEERYREDDYMEALLAAANKEPGTKIVVRKGTDATGRTTHLEIIVKYKIKDKTKAVRVGLLRCVEKDDKNNTMYPETHNSGLRNMITFTPNGSELDNKSFFNALINERHKNENANSFFNLLVEYNVKKHTIKQKLENETNPEKINELENELRDLVTEKIANAVLNNPLVEKFTTGLGNSYSHREKEDKDKVIELFNAVGSILFYSPELSALKYNVEKDNTFSVLDRSMRERYAEYTRMVVDNYKHTYELQKGLENNDEVEVNLNVPYFTIINTIPNNRRKNIKNSGFGKRPLVIVQNGRIVDQQGNDCGNAPTNIANNSMGILIADRKHDGFMEVAYFNTAVELTNKTFGKNVKKEFDNILTEFLNAIKQSNGGVINNDVWNNIFTKLQDLFTPNNLIYFPDIFIRNTPNEKTITLFKRNPDRTETKLLTFSNDDNKGAAIGVNINNKIIYFTDLEKDHELRDHSIITKEDINNAKNNIFNILFKSIKLNRSVNVFNSKSNSSFIKKDNGKFTVTLGGITKDYANYKAFLIDNEAFEVTVEQKNGSFLTHIINPSKVTLFTKVSRIPNVNPENTYVTDAIFNQSKRKTVDTRKVLEAAGVEQEKIDILLNENLPIANKTIVPLYEPDPSDTKAVEFYNRHKDSNAIYNISDGKIYITPKGAASMNGNPRNAVRIILHENLHRLFHKKSTYTDEQRDRIYEELKEVYYYTLNKIEEDYKNNKISKNFHNGIINLLNTATKGNDDIVAMEEFLMESLTQPVLANYLNNTDYHSTVNIKGIKQSKKSIFQKIIDILLKLLGVQDAEIKNNSILARQYMILSRTNESTMEHIEGTLFANASSPVEGNKSSTGTTTNTIKEDIETLLTTEQEIDNVINVFNSRITRADDFEETHIYLIDGKSADYSVTQKIHGKQDLGLYGVISSALGNTADAAARYYFENGFTIPDDFNLPNLTPTQKENLKKDLDKLKQYLDNTFGKNKYKVITKEFAIGGRVLVNGEEKTIAGTMDMLVLDNKGNIHIFDFKTKRFTERNNGVIEEKQLAGYKNQVNIYRQLLEENFPSLKGRVKTGGLIKFLVEYDTPSDKLEYINKDGQILVKTENGEVKIQDSNIDYEAPYFTDMGNFKENHIIEVAEQDFTEKILSLPNTNNESLDEKEFDEDFIDISNFGDIEELNVNTDLLEIQENDFLTIEEIYSRTIDNINEDNPFSVQVATNMNEFIDSFPVQFREQTKLLLDNNELKYYCK